jgi:hypothetical protein
MLTTRPHKMPHVQSWSFALSLLLMLTTSAAAGPFPPPGGPHRHHHGGDNNAPYPPLNSLAVENPQVPGTVRASVLAFPNPSLGGTRFRAVLPPSTPLRARLYSVSGQRVREWTSVADRTGQVEWDWDGADARNHAVAPGLYFLQIQGGGQTAHVRVVLLRR